MMTPHDRQIISSTMATQWPRMLAIFPLIILIVIAVWLGGNNWRANQQVRAELMRITREGKPIDNATMTRWLDRRTSRKGTSDWSEIMSLVSHHSVCAVQGFELPHVGAAKVRYDDQRADNAEQVAAYLTEMAPIIERIADATQHATPVWEPFVFDGFNTSIEVINRPIFVQRLLQLEVDEACHKKDAERALRSLKSMAIIPQVYDWNFAVICDLIHCSAVNMHHYAIRRSLLSDTWTDTQLLALVNMVRDRDDFGARWSNAMAGERAMWLASRASFDYDVGLQPHVMHWLMQIPTRLQFDLQHYRRLEELARTDYTKLRASAAAVELALPFGPAAEAYAAALYDVEDSRRHTYTALTVKRFQLKNGRWPNGLSELAEFGLTAEDWSTMESGPFGYRVFGGEATLWGVDLRRRGPVPQDLSTLLSSDPDDEPSSAICIIR